MQSSTAIPSNGGCIVVTVDAATSKILVYLNGALVVSAAFSREILGAYLGVSRYVTIYSFRGKLSNVREFNRTLTAAEAMQLSNEVR